MSRGPYFITNLEADVRVQPNQMNNNILDNIRQTLVAKKTGLSHMNYGIIVRILEVNPNVKGGIIRAEDPTASALYRVSFKCRLCNPLKKSVIMGRIVTINNKIIVAEDGPIKFLIGETDINTNNIRFSKSAFYPVSAQNEIIAKPIHPGTYVMIKVMGKQIRNNRSIVFGRLESVVPDDMIKQHIANQYMETNTIDANDLLRADTNVSDEVETIYAEETETNGAENDGNNDNDDQDN